MNVGEMLDLYIYAEYLILVCSLYRKNNGTYTACILIFLVSFSLQTEQRIPVCPDHCACALIRSRGNKTITESQKLKCGGEKDKIKIEELNIEFISANIIELNLSENDVTQLVPSFLVLPNLKELDLSKNQIDSIQAKAFQNVTNIRKLDLSSNKLIFVRKYMFEYLELLETLKLNENFISTIHDGTFYYLNSLKQLNISENPLHCNCDMKWLSEWFQNKKIKLKPQPKCESPAIYKGQLLKKIKFNCTRSEHEYSSHLQLKPVNNQVVFEGDSLKLECRSLSVGSIGGENKDARVVWSWKDKDPAVHFQEIKIENFSFDDYGYVESHVNIDHILRDHSGNWNCHLLSEQGNHSRTISVIVISEDTQYCSQNITTNNKGVYVWPETVVGFTVEILCEGEQLTDLHQRSQYKAYHTCTEAGIWDKLNTTVCPYTSETTKIFEHFSKSNINLTKKTVLEHAKSLRNFTVGKVLNDSMDIVFIVKTIESYLNFVSTEKELGSVIIDILSAVSKLSKSLLKSAQFEDLSCSRIVKSIEMIAEHTPSLQSHKSNLAVEEFKVTKDSFSGITCIWYTNSQTSLSSGKFFHCSTSNKTTLLGTSEKIIEASIQIPSSLFYQLELQNKLINSVQQLLVTMYENNNFFPRLDSEIHDKKDVTSCVVGSKLVELDVNNLTDPVYVMLRAPVVIYANTPKPVWWDSTMSNGTGGWNNKGCNLSQFVNGLLVFYCNRLGYFGLLQDTHYLHEYSGRYVGAEFRLCHPAVYIGSFILLVCLMASIVTYTISHSCIQMSRRTKHSLVNTWIAMSLLCFMFSFGIHQTEEMRTCQGVGLILHYFSLSTLLWMSVAASHMYKRLSKQDTIDHTAEDDLPPDEPIQKPILGLYLVGWGIGLIVCGISGAVNLKEYAGHNFCFLGTGPALSAVFVPAGMLLLFLFVFYLLTLCAIRNNDMNGQLSEGTQGTENVDLELLEVPLNNSCVEQRSIQSIITPTDSDDIEDPEHAPIVQLKAQGIVLSLFLLAWLAAADSISHSFSDIIPYEEDIFSTIYCLLTIFLGTFILYFYCVARSDVRAQWYMISKFLKGNSSHCCRTRNISDTLSPLPVPNPPVPLRNGNHHTVPTLSSSSVNSSGITAKSNSHNSNRAKAAKKLNTSNGVGEPVVMHSKTTNSVNLVVMHRQIYRSNNSMPTYHEISGPDCAEAFYNPHQSIVARKFFKKQKRNQRNDLGLRRRGDGGGTSDGGLSQEPRPWRPSAESAVFLSSDMENASDKLGSNLFGHGSKINNTNLHIGKANRHKRSRSSRDPNILTNSEGEDDRKETKLPMERLVIGAEEGTPISVALKGNDSPRSLTPDCNLSRVDEVSASEEVNSTAVNMSEMSECQQRMEEVSQLKDTDTTDDDYSNEVCEDITLTCPDYRTVELQCSLGENSCSDLNSEINYCENVNNDEYSCQANCCVERDACPPDCCSKEENNEYYLKKSSPSHFSDEKNSLIKANYTGDVKMKGNTKEDDSDVDDRTLNLTNEETEYDSFHRKIDNLRFSSKNGSCSNSLCYIPDCKSETSSQKSPPKYVTVLDPQFGMVKVTLGEYQESAHRLSLAQEELPYEKDGSFGNRSDTKTETSV